MAVPTSFKQQCPSCEAMVPIRDPKLIGRKIDCPKCKYRFIVEEPADEAGDGEDEGPAKKGKSSTAITSKKAAAAKGAKAPAKRRADDDQDLDETRQKKKQGGSGMLIVGILLAAVALISLAIGGYFILSSDSSEEKTSTTRPSTASNASSSGEQKKAEEPPKPEGPRPRHEDITNLLPNDTQFVLNMPMEHLLGIAKVNQALLKTPGSFHEGAFQSIWGISPTDVRRVVIAANAEKKTTFAVMRTKVQMKEKQIVEGLKLKAEQPINGLNYYLVKKPLDALSTFLLKFSVQHDKVALHFMDPFTVVCADVGPMNEFLKEKGQPKHLSKQEAEEEKKEGGEQQGGPPGGMQGGGPPAGMQGGPPGGRQGGPPNGMQGGRPQGGMRGGPMMSAPGGGPGGPGGSGSGGFRPPTGMPGGAAPPGMTGEGAGANEPAPVSTSYMTIDPQLKAVLDQVEKVDKTDNQNVLLSTALSTSVVSADDLKKLMAQAQAQEGSNIPQIPDTLLNLGWNAVKDQLKAVAVAVTEFNESKVAGNAAVAAKDTATAQNWEKQANENIPNFLTAAGLDFLNRNASSNNNRPNMPNMGGMMGGPPAGMMGGPPAGMMGGGPANDPRRGGRGMQGGPMGGPMGPGAGSGAMRPPMGPMGGGGRGPMMPPGGFQGGMQPPGMQPQGDGQTQTEEAAGKHGDYGFWTKNNVLALGLAFNMSQEKYAATGFILELEGIYLRSVAAMSDRKSHIHELAAAMQAYFEEKGQFPRGALVRPFDSQRHLDWRPDQRISWMAQILPYLANGEFRDIKPDYGKENKTWYEDLNNIKAGMTVIPQFVVPPSKTENDLYFYVTYPNIPAKSAHMLWATTHFVGMAGVGLDAAEYRADDPATAKLRGVFGYDRETKKADIKDGLEQTIVLIQVPPEPKAPWIAGGGSTVRGVSEDADCVKPFVCTEYQGKRGTFAIMADGKVRFIPATINPKTFQAMCTIAGGDKIRDLEKVAPEVPLPEDQPEVELKAEQPAQKPGQTPPAAPKTPEVKKPDQPAAPAAPKEPATPPSKK